MPLNLLLAYRGTRRSLEHSCLIAFPLKAVIKTPAWGLLEKHQVVEILSRETLRIDSEDDVVKALKLWAEHGEGSRKGEYEEMVQDPTVLRIDCVSKDTLASLVKEDHEQALEGYLHSEMLARLEGSRSPAMRLWQRRSQCIGKRVLKDFGGVPFTGTVTAVELEDITCKVLLSIRYDDGDCEDLYVEEADLVLAAAEAAGIGSEKAPVSAKRKSGTALTPGSSKKKKTPASTKGKK